MLELFTTPQFHIRISTYILASSSSYNSTCYSHRNHQVPESSTSYLFLFTSLTICVATIRFYNIPLHEQFCFEYLNTQQTYNTFSSILSLCTQTNTGLVLWHCCQYLKVLLTITLCNYVVLSIILETFSNMRQNMNNYAYKIVNQLDKFWKHISYLAAPNLPFKPNFQSWKQCLPMMVSRLLVINTDDAFICVQSISLDFTSTMPGHEWNQTKSIQPNLYLKFFSKIKWNKIWLVCIEFYGQKYYQREWDGINGAMAIAKHVQFHHNISYMESG